MTTSRTLQAEDRVAHYRVVGPLGAGGMGEVYLAQDQTLERNVALKVLPSELVRSEDRVRRFVQEAKSASSLNHPNIITIYEIGEEPVESASGEVSSDPVRYISMELVSGRTLSTKIHEEKTDLRTLLGYLAQAAEGISKAHAAGIVHRDLKPGNIMVSDDGFAKVLDFGLAKLTEKHGPDEGSTIATLAATEGQTAEGTVMGTVHYMSPEQVQGKTVDHRSDVFSFGCILYEAATRQRPFSGDSNVETMHKILHDRPIPIEEINAEVPNELRRLIRRCLKKAPDQRVQSMRDLALELREIVDEFDELSNSGTTAGSGSGLAAPVAPRRSYLLPVIVAGIVVIAAAAYFGLRHRGGAPENTAGSFQNARMSTATQNGGVRYSAISRDGRYLGYVAREGDGFALFVRQVATGADVQVVAPTDKPLLYPEFSVDGNYLYYTTTTPDAPRYRTLYRVPSLGGQPEKRGFDVDSPVTFSPNGAQMAFIRFTPDGAGTIQVMPENGGEPSELFRIHPPEQLAPAISWSPDGKKLAVTTFTPPPVTQAAISTIDIAGGKRTDILTRKPAIFSGLAWAPNGNSLIVTGVDAKLALQGQVFLVSYPGGDLRPITRDFSSYSQPSVSNDGVVSALRLRSRPDIWSIDPKTGNSSIIVRSTSEDTAPTTGTACGNVALYAQQWEEGSRLYALSPDGGSPRIIPTGDGLISQVDCGGTSVFFGKFDFATGQASLWTVGMDGTGLHSVSDEVAGISDVSADGRYVAYTVDGEQTVLWIYNTETQTQHRLPEALPSRNSTAIFSPDGTRILVALNDTSGELVKTVYKVFPVEGDAPPQVLKVPPDGSVMNWAPDGNAVVYASSQDPARNGWQLPLDGGEPTQLTTFTEGQVVWGHYSPAGDHAVVARSGDDMNLWLVDDKTHEANQITSFSSKTFFWWDWLGDSSRIVAAVGDMTRDVVLIRDFQ